MFFRFRILSSYVHLIVIFLQKSTKLVVQIESHYRTLIKLKLWASPIFIPFFYFFWFDSHPFIFVDFVFFLLFSFLFWILSFSCLSQHTPVRFTDFVSGGKIKYVFMHSPECHTLKWLGKEICQHILSWAICDFDLSSFDLICHKKLPYIGIFHTLAARCLTIFW